MLSISRPRWLRLGCSRLSQANGALPNDLSAQELPKIAYITRMDRYLMTAMLVTMIAWTTESVVVKYVCSRNDVDPNDVTSNCQVFDQSFALVYFLLWTLFHMYIVRNVRSYDDDSDRPHWHGKGSEARFHTSRMHRKWKEVLNSQIHGGAFLRAATTERPWPAKVKGDRSAKIAPHDAE